MSAGRAAVIGRCTDWREMNFAFSLLLFPLLLLTAMTLCFLALQLSSYPCTTSYTSLLHSSNSSSPPILSQANPILSDCSGLNQTFASLRLIRVERGGAEKERGYRRYGVERRVERGKKSEF